MPKDMQKQPDSTDKRQQYAAGKQALLHFQGLMLDLGMVWAITSHTDDDMFLIRMMELTQSGRRLTLALSNIGASVISSLGDWQGL